MALFLLPVATSGRAQQLSYSQLKSGIAAGQVRSVALGPGIGGIGRARSRVLPPGRRWG